MVLAVTAVLLPAAVAPIPCAAAATQSPKATPGVAPRLPASVAGDAGAGGIGFPLPPPGRPRQDSLRNPALPIPPQVQRLYRAAGARYRLPWTLLAGIGMAETGHGHTTATSTAGAQGLMQFLPATFAVAGVDGDADGRVDIRSDADSIFSAANYLTRSGVSHGTAGVLKALRAYNRPSWYANDVLFYAARYGGGTVYGDAQDCGSTPSAAAGRQSPPLTPARVSVVLRFAADRAGGPYVMGATGPQAYDCSSLTQAAYDRAGISLPRTAAAQRSWLAAGNGTRISPGQERPGNLVFWDSYLGPNQIGHVMLVSHPTTKATIEARSTSDGIGHFTYTAGPRHHIFEIWRVANLT